MYLATEKLSPRGFGKKAVTLGKKVLNAAALGIILRPSWLNFGIEVIALVQKTRRTIVPSMVEAVMLHFGTMIREMKKSFPRPTRECARRIETEKEYARLVFISDVGSYIQLRKRRYEWHGRGVRKAYSVHPEWNYADPGFIIKCIENEPTG